MKGRREGKSTAAVPDRTDTPRTFEGMCRYHNLKEAPKDRAKDRKTSNSSGSSREKAADESNNSVEDAL